MKNWTINEAVKVINENKDIDAVKEIVTHFPVFAMAAAKNDLAGVAALMGEKFTLGRLAKEPIGTAVGNEDDGEDEEASSGAEESDGKSLEEMSTKELIKLCDKRGIKVPHYGKNKQFYIDALNGSGGKGKKDEAEKVEGEVDGGEEEWTEMENAQEADPYEGKTAKELHMMCKERGIKADIKKPAAFYADLLRKDDEAKSKAANQAKPEEDEDEWGEDETQEKQQPKGKQASANKQKAAKKQEDADDEWDI